MFENKFKCSLLTSDNEFAALNPLNCLLQPEFVFLAVNLIRFYFLVRERKPAWILINESRSKRTLTKRPDQQCPTILLLP